MYVHVYACMYVYMCIYVYMYICMHMCMYMHMYTSTYQYINIYIYICIYISIYLSLSLSPYIYIGIYVYICIYRYVARLGKGAAANLGTKILDVRGFDSSGLLIWRGGMFMSIENPPESLSRAILVGRFLVWRLGVAGTKRASEKTCAKGKVQLTRLLSPCTHQVHSNHTDTCHIVLWILPGGTCSSVHVLIGACVMYMYIYICI